MNDQQVGENSRLRLVTEEYEGVDLMVFHEEGRPWFIANQIGRVLGYGENGNILCKKIAQNWADEVESGVDRRTATGKRLQEIKDMEEARTKLVPAYQRAISAYASQAMMLSESGVYQVCFKSNKDKAKRFRRWLSSEMLPAYRVGLIQPVSAPPTLPTPKVPPTPAELELSRFRSENRRENRKLRLLERQQEEVVAQAEHERKLGVYRTELALLQELERDQHINPRALLTAKIALNQKLTGDRLNVLKPAGKWLAPAQMAWLWGTSQQVIGRCITDTGIRGDERYCRQVTKKARGGVQKLVETYEYNEEGQELIREAFDEYVAEHLEKQGEERA